MYAALYSTRSTGSLNSARGDTARAMSARCDTSRASAREVPLALLDPACPDLAAQTTLLESTFQALSSFIPLCGQGDPDYPNFIARVSRLANISAFLDGPGVHALAVSRIYPSIFSFVRASILRPTTPNAHSTVGGPGGPLYSPAEDEPTPDRNWPLVRPAYEVLLRWISQKGFDRAAGRALLTDSFVTRLVGRLACDDPREHDFVKAALHRLYRIYPDLRPHIRTQLVDTLAAATADEPRHAGIAATLAILAPITAGFVVPLAPQYVKVLMSVLLPLHSSPYLPAFFPELSYCVMTFITRQPTLAKPALTKLIKYLPKSDSRKTVLFLDAIAGILRSMPVRDFDQQLAGAVARFVAGAAASPQAQIAEAALQFFDENEVFSVFLTQRQVLYTIMLPCLAASADGHWAPPTLAANAALLSRFRMADSTLFDTTIVQIPEFNRSREVDTMQGKQIIEQYRRAAYERVAEDIVQRSLTHPTPLSSLQTNPAPLITQLPNLVIPDQPSPTSVPDDTAQTHLCERMLLLLYFSDACAPPCPPDDPLRVLPRGQSMFTTCALDSAPPPSMQLHVQAQARAQAYLGQAQVPRQHDASADGLITGVNPAASARVPSASLTARRRRRSNTDTSAQTPAPIPMMPNIGYAGNTVSIFSENTNNSANNTNNTTSNPVTTALAQIGLTGALVPGEPLGLAKRRRGRPVQGAGAAAAAAAVGAALSGLVTSSAAVDQVAFTAAVANLGNLGDLSECLPSAEALSQASVPPGAGTLPASVPVIIPPTTTNSTIERCIAETDATTVPRWRRRSLLSLPPPMPSLALPTLALPAPTPRTPRIDRRAALAPSVTANVPIKMTSLYGNTHMAMQQPTVSQAGSELAKTMNMLAEREIAHGARLAQSRKSFSVPTAQMPHLGAKDSHQPTVVVAASPVSTPVSQQRAETAAAAAAAAGAGAGGGYFGRAAMDRECSLRAMSDLVDIPDDSETWSDTSSI